MMRSLVVVFFAVLGLLPARAELPAEGLFARTNLVAWCIVPFDSRKRGPEERAAMLEQLGIRRLAYDWRAEHLPTFDAEIDALQKRRIELTAWWFPAALNDDARAILDCLARHRLHPELWVTLGTEPEPDPERLARKIEDAAATLTPICDAAAKLGSTVGLYNHLGWFGEPIHQLAVIERLRAGGRTNVGIVYNFHHAHDQIDRFPELLRAMKPHLLAVNLNGMIRGGDRAGKKIIPLGTGDEELPMMQALARSGWRGPVGILGHTDEDAELKLRKELAGLEQLVRRLDQPLPPRPAAPAIADPSPSPASAVVEGRHSQALDARVRGLVTAGKSEFRQPPITVEAWVRLTDPAEFNIIAASESKSAPSHWELYTYAGSGELSFFVPSAAPSEIKSGTPICDGQWHHVAARYRPGEVELFVDGRSVVRQAIRSKSEALPGAAQFAIGRLVEGGLGCRGWIETVRLSRGERDLAVSSRSALFADADTLGFWAFETVNDLDGWSALASTVPPAGPSRLLPPAAGAPGAPGAPGSDAPTGAPSTSAINRDEPWKQTEGDWVDDRWNQTTLERWQAYYLPTPTGTVRKGLAIRVGPESEGAVCYDTATGNWRAAWLGGFLRFDPARFGLLNAPRIDGQLRFEFPPSLAWRGGEFKWRRHAVVGNRVILEYTVGDVLIRESPWLVTEQGHTFFLRDMEIGPSRTTTPTFTVLTGPQAQAVDGDLNRSPWLGFQDGDHLRALILDLRPGLQVLRPGLTNVDLAIAPRDRPLRSRFFFHSGTRAQLNTFLPAARKAAPFPKFANLDAEAKGPSPDPLPVKGQRGAGNDAYVIDTIPVPYDNPWKSLMFCSGVGFFDNGDAAVATIHGDVWRVSGLDEKLDHVAWRRIATGLYQPLGLTVIGNEPIVLCRDHLTRLVDRDGDGATDFYQSLSSLIDTSGGGHDYVTSLCRDRAGNFYYVDPTGAHRLSPDGTRKETIARGFRNANGMGVSPDGRIVLVAPQQGEWTPSSVIHELRPGGWYGYPGPKPAPERPLGYDLPLCWIPHRIDNSSGSQVWVEDPRFGPLAGNILHLSWGRCTMLLTLRDEVEGVAQGAVMPLKGRFLSGPMRGEINPRDGQLYVVGCQGWQTAAARDGSFQRVRWTGKSLALPVAWKALPGALRLTFNEPLDREAAEDTGSYSLEAWNYRYAAQYGSKDWSVKSPDSEGHDTWNVASAQLESDGKSVILRVPDLKPVMQFGLKFNLDTAKRAPAAGELYGTIHRLHPR